MIVEKSLNVHFNDYMGKITPGLMQNFFFDQSNTTNLFYEDYKLANYWRNMTGEKRKVRLDHMSEIEKELIKEEN